MTGISWWRSWHGAPTDHKWAVIAARSGVKTGVVIAVAWAMLDYASQQTERGSVTGFDPEEFAIFSGFSEDEIKTVIQAMNDKDIIKDDRFTNWERRQPKREDDSSERVSRFRDKKRNVTQCNAPDTDTESDTDKDSDKEEEQEQSGAAAASISHEFASLCTVYEKNIGNLTPMISDSLQDDLDTYGLQNCMDAITEALKNNVRRWNYVQGILRRWKTEGRDKPKPNTPPPPRTRKVTDVRGNVIAEVPL